MSHIKDRLSNYHDFMKKLADDHQMVLASDVLEMIEQLQDDLGYFHDVYGNREWLAQLLAQSEDKQLHYEAGLVVGWQTLQGKLKMEKYLR